MPASRRPQTKWFEQRKLIAPYTPTNTPLTLARMLRSYLDPWGLVYGCFDVGLDRDGVFWFYECNPAGEWGWLEARTGLPIAAAFADVLEIGLRP